MVQCLLGKKKKKNCEFLPLFWERPLLIKIDTYFHSFPSSPTQTPTWNNPPSQLTTVQHCLRLTDCNRFPPLVQFILFCRESFSSCAGYLLLLINALCFYPIPGAFQCCHCALLKSDRNMEGMNQKERKKINKKTCDMPFITFCNSVCFSHFHAGTPAPWAACNSGCLRRLANHAATPRLARMRALVFSTH